MATVELSNVDLERGGSCYSDTEEFYSTNGGSFDDFRFANCGFSDAGGGGGDSGGEEESRRSWVSSECSVDVVEKKVHLGKEEKDCRICHLGLDSGGGNDDESIELGCSCKDDLAVAHKHCAEAWFKIRGNKVCEICNTIARNVATVIEVERTEPSNESSSSTVTITEVAPAAAHTTDGRRFFNGNRFLNFLLACMVFAFVISWLFHFNVPS